MTTLKDEVRKMREEDSGLWRQTYTRSDQYQKALKLTTQDVELLQDRKQGRGWPSVQDHLAESCARVTCDDGTVVGITACNACTPGGWKELLMAGIIGEHPTDLQTGMGTTLTFILPGKYHVELLESLQQGAYQTEAA